MSNPARFALVAAAVALVAVVGVSMLPNGGGFAGPGSTATPVASAATPTAAPTAALTASSSPTALEAGELDAGTYVVRPFKAPNSSISFALTVPDGWEAGGPAARAPVGISPTRGFEAPDGMGLGFLLVDSLESDPCRWNGSEAVAVGPGIIDLTDALRANPGYRVSSPGDITIGGYRGILLDVEVPAALDLASCDEGEFWIWADADGQSIYAHGPEMRFHLHVLDVEGLRVIVVAHDFPGTSAADREELQAIVASIEIDP